MICLTQGKSRCSTVKVSFSRRAQRSRVSTNFTPTAACLASRLHRLGWTGYGPIQRLHLPPRAWECHVAHRPRALGKEFKNGIQKPLRSSAIQEAFRENSLHTSPAGPDVRNDNGAEAQSYAGPTRSRLWAGHTVRSVLDVGAHLTSSTGPEGSGEELLSVCWGPSWV